MSQPPGGYLQPGPGPGPQGGYNPVPGQPVGSAPQAPGPQGYPQQGYPQQGYPQQGYPQQGYPQQGGYPPQGGYPAGGGYGQPVAPGAQGGYGPPGVQGGYGPQFAGGPPPPQDRKKSPAVLIAIVVAALVLVTAVGGIIMALSTNDGDQPVSTITPSQPTAPPDDPTPSPQPTDDPSPSSSPTPSEPTAGPSDPPAGGDTIPLGNGVRLIPAEGWTVKAKTATSAQLSDGENIFQGQSAKVSPSTNPGQLCTAWHKEIAEGTSGGKYGDPKDVDLGTKKLKGSSCVAQVTVSTGQGSSRVYLFSLVSVRPTDGVTTVGTLYFTEPEVSDQVNQEFGAMVDSMLRSQAGG